MNHFGRPVLGLKLRRAAGLLVTCAGVVALTACTGSGHSPAPTKPTASRISARPITVALTTDQHEVGATSTKVTAAASQARTGGHAGVADTLTTYAGLIAAGDTINYLACVADCRAAYVVTQQFDRATDLATLVKRLAAESTAQGATASASALNFHGTSAWQLVHDGGPGGIREITYWVDLPAGRYSIDAVGLPDDVAALANETRISS